MIQERYFAGGFHQAYPAMLETIMMEGYRVTPRPDGSLGMTEEVLDYSFSIPSTMPFCRYKCRKLSLKFLFLEPIFLFTNQESADIASALMHYAPNLKQLSYNEDTGSFDGNYGDRIDMTGAMGDRSMRLGQNTKGITQLRRCYEILKKDRCSRRAVVTIHNPAYDIIDGNSKDIPCTLSLQFIIRQGQMHCFCTMRSNDAWYGTPHNVMMFTFLQRAMASWLGVEPGTYTHRANSFHLYSAHVEKARELVLQSRSEDPELYDIPHSTTYPDHKTPDETMSKMAQLICYEKSIRENDLAQLFEARHEYEQMLVWLLSKTR